MYPAAALVVLHCIVIIISTSGLIHVTYWVPAELLECFHRQTGSKPQLQRINGVNEKQQGSSC